MELAQAVRPLPFFEGPMVAFFRFPSAIFEYYSALYHNPEPMPDRFREVPLPKEFITSQLLMLMLLLVNFIYLLAALMMR